MRAPTANDPSVRPLNLQDPTRRDLTLHDPLYVPYRYQGIVGLGMLLLMGLLLPYLPAQPARTAVIPDLSVSTTMSPSEIWAANQPFEIRITATNHDASAATSATIEATVPFDAQLEVPRNSSGGACDIRPERGNTRLISCAANIKADSTATVTIKGTAPDRAGTHRLSSNVKIGGWRQSHPADPDPSNNATSTALTVL